VSLRDQVEQLLPGWKRWYPSLFEAARDLGLIRARVCSPDSLGRILAVGTPEAVKSSNHPIIRQFLHADFKREKTL
jgi:hypothetical protein